MRTFVLIGVSAMAALFYGNATYAAEENRPVFRCPLTLPAVDEKAKKVRLLWDAAFTSGSPWAYLKGDDEGEYAPPLAAASGGADAPYGIRCELSGGHRLIINMPDTVMGCNVSKTAPPNRSRFYCQ